MQQNAPTLKSCCKLLHWAGKVFVIPPGFCYIIAEFPIAYCCIWHGSCLGTLYSVAFSRVLREYPVGVRVKIVTKTHIFQCILQSMCTFMQFSKRSLLSEKHVHISNCRGLFLPITYYLFIVVSSWVSSGLWVLYSAFIDLEESLVSLPERYFHNLPRANNQILIIFICVYFLQPVERAPSGVQGVRAPRRREPPSWFQMLTIHSAIPWKNQVVLSNFSTGKILTVTYLV